MLFTFIFFCIIWRNLVRAVLNYLYAVSSCGFALDMSHNLRCWCFLRLHGCSLQNKPVKEIDIALHFTCICMMCCEMYRPISSNNNSIHFQWICPCEHVGVQMIKKVNPQGKEVSCLFVFSYWGKRRLYLTNMWRSYSCQVINRTLHLQCNCNIISYCTILTI